MRDSHTETSGHGDDETKSELAKEESYFFRYRRLQKAAREYLDTMTDYSVESWKHKITPRTIERKQEAEKTLLSLLEV